MLRYYLWRRYVLSVFWSYDLGRIWKCQGMEYCGNQFREQVLGRQVSTLRLTMTTQEFNVEDPPVSIKWPQGLATFVEDGQELLHLYRIGSQLERLPEHTKVGKQSNWNIRLPPTIWDISWLSCVWITNSKLLHLKAALTSKYVVEVVLFWA